MRVLLLQVRESADVAEHERRCVLERIALEPEQLESVNLVEEPKVGWDRIAQNNAVIIGGAGVHSATNDDEFTPGLIDLVRRMVEQELPLFGSCYGHQIIARALGGEVIHDPEHAEVGAHEVEITEAGRSDPLFGTCPERMPVLMGHQDRVSRLPEGAVELARSETCGNQAFRVEGKPVYCTQFHTELSPERILERLELYRHIYMPDEQEFAAMKESLVPTPDAELLMRRFLERHAVRGARR